jgi:uncharacterized protein (TIGR02722 family)
MKTAGTFVLAIVVMCMLISIGCSSKKKVTRIPEDSVTDLSGYWNDTDSRLVADEMINDCLTGAWKANHWEEKHKKAVMIVGVVRNKTSEHIAIDTFIGDMERAFINSGQVTIVASSEEREGIREERQDQQTYSSEETMKRWGREVGADYMLGGTISSITDEVDGERVVFYQIDLTLFDLETNAKVWAGQKKIKKYIGRAKVSL